MAKSGRSIVNSLNSSLFSLPTDKIDYDDIQRLRSAVRKFGLEPVTTELCDWTIIASSFIDDGYDWTIQQR